jgi:thymidine phosphorylase
VDDLLIRVERALDLDSDAQLVASVLSKKIAAGSTHVVIDIPVGPTAKVRTLDTAHALARLLERVGVESGLAIRPMVTDGSQPVGRGIGPALEAQDVVAVVRGDPDAPDDLRERAILLAGEILQLAGGCAIGDGPSLARAILADGRAWRKLQRICEAQGGMRTPPSSSQRFDLTAPSSGTVTSVDNRRLARTAKLAGAPADPAAGIYLHVRIGSTVDKGQPLFTLHAESPGELAYAQEYLAAHPGIVVVDEGP